MRSTLSQALFLATFAILSGQGCSLRSAPLWENFSGEKAFAHVQHLVDLGPRPAGSEALEKSRLIYHRTVEVWPGGTVARSEFSDQTPRGESDICKSDCTRWDQRKKTRQHSSFLLSLRHQDLRTPFAFV